MCRDTTRDRNCVPRTLSATSEVGLIAVIVWQHTFDALDQVDVRKVT